MAVTKYSFRKASQLAKKPLDDLAAYPVLTEEVGFPPSPLARQPGTSGSAPLGDMVSKAVSDVLGWKVKPGDTKGFMGALTQSFTLTEKEGHVESKWTPRTYAVQTDLAGGITGAQASVYSRGKVALDQCLPLLDGIYALEPEAIAEDVAALKAVVKSQLSELVNELAFLGGPRISRVNQYFNLLLGSSTFPIEARQGHVLHNTDPDKIGGTLGNLRDELGLSFTKDDFVNSVADETNLSNFRIISDYVTGLGQTWLYNLSFLVLNSKTPFFGTQLVLLSRQLSVVAESVDEVRFTLDSVFIGPAERQTMELNFPGATPPIASIFLEDLLSWIRDFSTEEGPRLIQDGGKFGVGNTFFPVVNNLFTIMQYVPNLSGQPPGFSSARVTLSIVNLTEQLGDLARLAKPIEHIITPEPFFGAFAVEGVQPNSGHIGAVVYVRGSGFACNPGVTGGGLTVQFRPSGFATPLIQAVTVYFRSDSLLVVTVPPGLTHGQLYDVLVTNPDGKTTFVSGGFTVS
jgi:hypothetical protein